MFALYLYVGLLNVDFLTNSFDLMQKKLGYNTNETFLVFIDLLTFLNSIRSFPDAS